MATVQYKRRIDPGHVKLMDIHLRSLKAGYWRKIPVGHTDGRDFPPSLQKNLMACMDALAQSPGPSTNKIPPAPVRGHGLKRPGARNKKPKAT